MSGFKRLAVGAVAAGLLAVAAGTARADFARGNFNNWANDCPLTQTGDYYSGTLQAHAGGSAGLKFDLDGNWGSSTWGGTSASAATVNQTVGSASWSQSGNLPMDVSDGYYYTFHLAGDYSWGERSYVVMKTKYPPATILNVENDSATAFEGEVTLTASCTAGTAVQISPEETFYILYSTDGWVTSHMVAMDGSGLVRRGKIPGQTAGTTVQYKVFGTTMPTNCLTTETIYSTPNNLQKIYFCMLSIKEGSYTTVSEDIEYVAGNAWHCPTNAEPWASATMRNPAEVVDGDFVFLRLGGYPASGADAITSAQLKYKVDSGSWTTRNLKPEDVSASDYPGNAYWTNSLPQDKMTEGAVVRYYFVAEFENSGQYTTTYVGTTNQTGSVAYLDADEAKAHPFQFTVGAAPAPDPGNVWHVPANLETWGRPMRDPLAPGDGAEPFLRLGNQTDVQSDWMTAANIKYRVGTSGAWSSIPMGWEEGAGGEGSQNAYWSNALPAVVEGQTVQYYFEAVFGNSASLGTTYVFDDGADGCDKGVDEAEAQASPFEFTVGAHVYNLGNCWHVPGQYEPWPEATMRNPCYPSAGEAICIFVGNQAYGDGGNPGDMSGGTLYHRAAGASAWSTVALEYEDCQRENNKYWKAIIPAGTYASAGDMEYYVEVTYNDHDTTYLGTDSGARSQTFATAAEVQQHLFTCPIGDTAGQEPGYMWHAGNAVVAGTNAVQFWVKIGYLKNGTNWAETVELRYNFKSDSVPRGAVRTGRTAKKRMSRSLSTYSTAPFAIDHEEEDGGGNGNAVWWACTLTDDRFTDPGQYLEYEIAAKNSAGNNQWRYADYRTGSATNLFYYTMFQAGSGALTVNGLNADYTTSKFFIDEAAGETVTLDVVYAPEVTSPYAVEIFSNVGRRDFWNADIDGDGVADAIRPPDGDLITADTTNSYFAAIPMEWDTAAHAYKKTLTVGKTGAYRLTARYKETADSDWVYYSAITNSLRDHAIVISPKKVLEQRVYEVNGMTAKSSAPTEAGHSTFADLIEGEDSFAEFGIPYLNKIQANCLWFQPIHTSSEYGLAEGGEPGSPYAAKDYFSVSKWYGKSGTTAGALGEFQSFVEACDAGRSPSMSTSYVGTINIMLDGVFNHTSWDAVFGVMGEELGIVPAGTGASTAIASVMPGWYANCSDYGAPATWYNGPGWGNHDIACGPDRGDFGKWEDTAELFYGRYSALVRHNPDNNGDYLNEDDQYDYTSMSEETEKLWDYMGSYVPYWLDQTGHDFGNEHMGEVDANGTAYDDYGIDGLRCDFGQGLPPQFWEYCINRARAKKWNFMFMAESLDGGKVSYRSNRHFDILNESFVFAARNAGNPSELLAVTDDKKNAYNGGAVLLNLTSHDEVMPYSDPWKTASRYAMLATVKGLPMTFYGQEQGIIPCDWGSDWAGEGTIIQPGNASFGFSKFELNFGKWVADFKTWNKMTVWDNPPMGAEASHGMAQLYGHVNWARASSPALQSDVQWMLDRVEGYRSTDVWAMAKAEEHGALASGKDAVLAFVLFVNDTHYATSQTFSIPEGAANLLGLEAGKSYTARNLASGNAEQILWTNTTEKLTSEGVWVNFTADQNGSAFYNDGAMVQFLKLEEYVPPTTYDITVTVGANGSVSPSGTVSVVEGEDQEFVITADTGYRIESVLADGEPVAEFINDDTSYSYTWEGVTADGTLEVTFTQQVWTITVSAGSNGSVTPNGSVLVQGGDGLEIVVTADAGYRIESVLVDLTPVRTFENTDTSYTYTWANVTADGTLAATFVEQTVEPEFVPSAGGVDVPVAWMEANYPGMTYEEMLEQVDETGANGRPVWDSYIANLDPTDPESRLDISAVEPATGTFTATVQPERRYRLQYADHLDGAQQWTVPAGTSWWTNTAATATDHEFTDGMGAEEAIRFYRIQVDLIRE